MRAAAALLPDVQLPGGAASPSAYAGTIFAGPLSPLAYNNVGSPLVPPGGGFGPARRGLVLGIPAPLPPPPADPGSGPWGAKDAGIGDRITKEKFRAIADAADAAGLNNAARNMNRYLDNNGDTLAVDPARMLRDLPGFRTAVDNETESLAREARTRALAALRENGGQAVSIPFATPWRDYYATAEESKDWFYAMGGFRYSQTGVVSASPAVTPGGEPRIDVDYRLLVHDRYNWDKGKGVNIPGIGGVGDNELGKLNEVGLAREYDIDGATGDQQLRVDGTAGQQDAPGPDASGQRDGARSDVGRENNRDTGRVPPGR